MRIAPILVLLAAGFAGFARGAEDGEEPPPPRYARFTLADGTSVAGEWLSFEGGYFKVQTRKGALLIPASRVRKITPLSELPPPPRRFVLRQGATDRMLALWKRRFKAGFASDPFLGDYDDKFRIIARIAYVAQKRNQLDMPFELINETRRYRLAKTGDRRCLLIACEALVNGIYGRKEKAKALIDSLPDYGAGKRVKDRFENFVSRAKNMGFAPGL